MSERGWRGRNVGSGGETTGYAEEKNEQKSVEEKEGQQKADKKEFIVTVKS